MPHRTLVVLSAAVLLASTSVPAAPPAEAASAPVTAAAAFERLASLSGVWQGSFEGEGGAVQITYRTISGGRAVLEALFPGTDHEMLSIYLLDGDALRMTHYCALGNQPRMRLDPKTSTPSEFHFVFDGGSNLDPAKDDHIHEGRITFGSDGTMVAAWTYNREGKGAGQHAMKLSRAPTLAH